MNWFLYDRDLRHKSVYISGTSDKSVSSDIKSNGGRDFCGFVSRNLVALSCDNIIGKHISRIFVKDLFVEIVIKTRFYSNFCDI